MADPVPGLSAHLQQKTDGSWDLWVALPDTAVGDHPCVRFPAGEGPGVAARTTALARLGFAPLGQDLDETGWQWREVRPDRGVRLLGRIPVRPLSAAELEPVIRINRRPGPPPAGASSFTPHRHSDLPDAGAASVR